MIKLSALLEGVRVDTSKYVGSHGKQPSGRGLWFFQVGEEKVQFNGSYADAKAFAVKAANKSKQFVIYPLP